MTTSKPTDDLPPEVWVELDPNQGETGHHKKGRQKLHLRYNGRTH